MESQSAAFRHQSWAPTSACIHTMDARGQLVSFMDPELPEVESLKKYGYAVVTVMSPEEAAMYRSMVWDDVEGLNTGIKRNDPTTWTSENWPEGAHGLFQSKGSGLHFGVCAARAATEAYWNKLFGGRQTISSFDAVSLGRPAYQEYAFKHGTDKNHKHMSNWLHRDQAWSKTELLRHVQGALALEDLGPAELRTQVIIPPEGETAQAFNDRFLDAFPYTENKKKGGFDAEREEWHKMTPEMVDWLANNGRAVAPTLKAGQMILWSSAMIHASVAGPLQPGKFSRNVRMSVFVSARPRELLSRAEILFRRELLEKGRTSGHRVCEPGAKPGTFRQCLFGINLQPRGKPVPVYNMDRVQSGFNIYSGKKRGRDDIEAPSEVHRATARFCGGYRV